MRVPFNLSTVIRGTLLLLALTCCAPDVQARPQYLKLFLDGYPKVAGAAQSKKCALCHEKDKKMRLPYGKAVEGGIAGSGDRGAVD